MKKELDLNLNNWKEIYNKLPCGIVSFNIDDLSLIHFNDMYAQNFECEENNILNIPQNHQQWFKAELNKQFGISNTAVLDYFVPEGRWIRLIAVLNSDGTVFAALVDVSDQYESIKSLKEKERILREKVETDPLSKVYTRSAAIEKINGFLSENNASSCALLVLDIDNFKTINDTYGHLYGDAIISMVASCIKNVVGENNIVGRFGGDEFFVFIKNNTIDEITSYAKQINDIILKLHTDVSDDTNISSSTGIAYSGCIGDNDTISYETLFAYADKALYMAKYNGKSRYEIYNSATMSNISGRGIGYSRTEQEEETTTSARDIVALAAEILAKSKNTDNAVHNVMRHICLQFDITFLQIMKIDTKEDLVTIEHDWSTISNTAQKNSKYGYYTHNDIECFLKRFRNKGYFTLSNEDISDFSHKMRIEFAKIEDGKVIYSAVNLNKEFYMFVYHYPDRTAVWTKEDIDIIQEITKLLSVFLEKNEYISYKEKNLIDRADFEPTTGLYNFPAFLTQASRIKKCAFDKDNNDFVTVHIEFVDFYKFYEKHTIGTGLSQVIEKFGIYLRNTLNANAAVATYLAGSEIFKIAIRFVDGDDDIKAYFKNLADDFFKDYLADFKDDNIVIHIGISHLPPDGSILAGLITAGNITKRISDKTNTSIIYDIEMN